MESGGVFLQSSLSPMLTNSVTRDLYIRLKLGQTAFEDEIINKQTGDKQFYDAVEKVRDPIQAMG